MNKNILLMITAGILLIGIIGSVSAGLESLGTFKQGDNIRVVQTCSDATFINISSISYPNSSAAITGVSMTSAGDGEYYYTFNYTQQTGRYDVRGISDGCEKTFAYYFDVNPTGTKGESVFNNAVLIILLIFSVGFLVLGLILKVPMFGFISSVLLIVMGVYTMIYGFNNSTDFYTRAVAICIIGIGFVVMFISAYEWMNLSGGESE